MSDQRKMPTMFKKLFTVLNDILRSRQATFGPDLTTKNDRQLALAHLRYFDHGILRDRWTNLEQITAGVWRSNQPNPCQIAHYASIGIKTILSLRGAGNSSHYLLEKEACSAQGVRLVALSLNARKAAPKERYLALLDLFETIEHPFLFHCKSGADRTGLAAVFYLLHMENVPLSIARKQLGLKYIHIRWLKTGVLDKILDAYAADINRNGSIQLRHWIEHNYDPDQITRSFKRYFVKII